MRRIFAALGGLLIVAAFAYSQGVHSPHQAADWAFRTVYAPLARFAASMHDQSLKTPDAVVYYPKGTRSQAAIIGQVATAAIPKIDKILGVHIEGSPAIELLPSFSTFNRALGWHGGTQASGAYETGTVYLLLPSSWIVAQDRALFARAVRRSTPVAHELTHLALDEQVNGNMPSWYNEGVAQYVDWRVTGFFWSPSRPLWQQSWYSAAQIAGGGGAFYALPDQELAYQEAFALVWTIVQRQGTGAIRQIDRKLAGGAKFSSVLKQVTGTTLPELIRQARQLTRSDPALFSGSAA